MPARDVSTVSCHARVARDYSCGLRVKSGTELISAISRGIPPCVAALRGVEGVPVGVAFIDF